MTTSTRSYVNSLILNVTNLIACLFAFLVNPFSTMIIFAFALAFACVVAFRNGMADLENCVEWILTTSSIMYVVVLLVYVVN